jgi:hypothetical protein
MSVELDLERPRATVSLPEPAPQPAHRFADETSVRGCASSSGASPGRRAHGDAVADFVLSVRDRHELLRHGGGAGPRLLARRPVAGVVIHGTDRRPLAGRHAVARRRRRPRIWIANHLADLVQLRSCADGTTVRAHVLKWPDATSSGARSPRQWRAATKRHPYIVSARYARAIAVKMLTQGTLLETAAQQLGDRASHRAA